MKKLAAVIIIGMCSVVYAVTTITYNIPNDKGQEILAAYIAQSDAEIKIEIRGKDGYDANLEFETPVYDPNISPAVFVKRRTALIALAFKEAHRQKIRNDERNAYREGAPEWDDYTPDPNEMN